MNTVYKKKSTMFNVYKKIKDGEYLVCDGKKVEIINTIPSNSFGITKKIKGMSEGNDYTESDMIYYHKEFLKNSYEIMKDDEFRINGRSFCYHAFNNQEKATVFLSNSLLKNIPKDAENMDIDEYFIHHECYRAGLIYGEKTEKKVNIWSYDVKEFYASLLSGNRTYINLPTKPGKFDTYEKLPKRNEIKEGFYKLKIICNESDFFKIFAISPMNWYHAYSLKHILQIQKDYPKWNLTLSLIHDEKPNVYIYDDKSIIKSKEIFNEWYNSLSKLRSKYPKNFIIKNLLSASYSYISLLFTTYADKSDDPNFYEHSESKNGSPKYFKLEAKYKSFNMFGGRLHCIVSAKGRYELYKIIKKYTKGDLKIVKRVFIDSMTVTKDLGDEPKKSNMHLDEKTTGLFKLNGKRVPTK